MEDITKEQYETSSDYETLVVEYTSDGVRYIGAKIFNPFIEGTQEKLERYHGPSWYSWWVCIPWFNIYR